jgi:hypothetical protein
LNNITASSGNFVKLDALNFTGTIPAKISTTSDGTTIDKQVSYLYLDGSQSVFLPLRNLKANVS